MGTTFLWTVDYPTVDRGLWTVDYPPVDRGLWTVDYQTVDYQTVDQSRFRNFDAHYSEQPWSSFPLSMTS